MRNLGLLLVVACSSVAVDAHADSPPDASAPVKVSVKDRRELARAELGTKLRALEAEIASLQQQGQRGQRDTIRLTDELDQHWSNLSPCGSSQLSAQMRDELSKLRDELLKVGVELNPADLDALVAGITRGGQAGIALAMFIVMQISDMRVDPKSAVGGQATRDALGALKPATEKRDGGTRTAVDLLQQRLGATNFLALNPAELEQAAARGSKAGEYLSALFKKQMSDRLASIATDVQARRSAAAAIEAQLKSP